MGEELRIRFSPGIMLLAHDKRRDPGYVYTLDGDLHHMHLQREYLQRNGFDVGQCGVHPVLKTEAEFARALALIWENKAAGWWLYERHYIKYEICTKEEFWAALRPHPLFVLGDLIDWNLDKWLVGLDSENSRVARFSEFCMLVAQELGPGPFRVSAIASVGYSEIYRPYYQTLIPRKQVFGVWLVYDRRAYHWVWVDESALKISGNEKIFSWPAHLFRRI